MKDMDAEYILPKLEELCALWYYGDPFAKYSERRGLYVFGSIDGNVVIKNVVTKAVAIYLCIDKIESDGEF